MKGDVFIVGDGVLKIKGQTLLFISKERKQTVPVEKVDSIYHYGSGSVSLHVFKYLSKYGIPLHFFNRYHVYIGSFFPKKSRVSGDMVVRQVKAFLDKEKR